MARKKPEEIRRFEKEDLEKQEGNMSLLNHQAGNA